MQNIIINFNVSKNLVLRDKRTWFLGSGVSWELWETNPKDGLEIAISTGIAELAKICVFSQHEEEFTKIHSDGQNIGRGPEWFWYSTPEKRFIISIEMFDKSYYRPDQIYQICLPLDKIRVNAQRVFDGIKDLITEDIFKFYSTESVVHSSHGKQTY